MLEIGKDAARGIEIPMAWQHGGPGQAYGRWLGAATETSTSLLLNVGVLRGVCGVGFEGGRFLLNNCFRGSNFDGKGDGGMAVYGAGESGMSGAGRASVSTRFWLRGSDNIRDTLAEGWSFVGNNVGLASNNLVDFLPDWVWSCTISCSTTLIHRSY